MPENNGGDRARSRIGAVVDQNAMVALIGDEGLSQSRRDPDAVRRVEAGRDVDGGVVAVDVAEVGLSENVGGGLPRRVSRARRGAQQDEKRGGEEESQTSHRIPNSIVVWVRH